MEKGHRACTAGLQKIHKHYRVRDLVESVQLLCIALFAQLQLLLKLLKHVQVVFQPLFPQFYITYKILHVISF